MKLCICVLAAFTEFLFLVFAWWFSSSEGGSRGFTMMLKFELEKFTIAPTEEQFEKCRKDDLLLIADFFDINVPRNALKRDIKEALHKELVKQRILPGETEVTGVATNPVFSDDLEALEMELKSEEDISIDPGNPSSPKGKMLAIRLKELDVELGCQQYQSQLLHVRALELETKRDIRAEGAGN